MEYINNIDYNIISTINCKSRNNYDKQHCEKLNPDNINTFLKSYEKDPFEMMDKNIFSLIEQNSFVKNKSKKECAIQAIQNNYAGFSYKGDKNKCILYSSDTLENKINKNENEKNKKNYKTYIKTKNIMDLKIDDQHNVNNYFKESNNYGFIPNSKITEFQVENENECMNYCLKDSDKCKSILFLEDEKECIFYDKKDILINDKFDNNKYDNYTIKSNKKKENEDIIVGLLNDVNKSMVDNYYYCTLNNNICIEDYKINKNNYENNIEIADRSEENNVPIYKCDTQYSTNPFCTEKYNADDNQKSNLISNKKDYYSDCNLKTPFNNINTYKEQVDIYDKYCRAKYGDEYVFDNNSFDLNTVKNCEKKDEIMVKCKMNFDTDLLNSSKIENFQNNDRESCLKTNSNNHFYLVTYVIFAIVIVLFIVYLVNIGFMKSKNKN
jgi:hypothetical protein